MTMLATSRLSGMMRGLTVDSSFASRLLASTAVRSAPHELRRKRTSNSYPVRPRLKKLDSGLVDGVDRSLHPACPSGWAFRKTVRKSLRLISNGVLDEGSVAELAAKVGVKPPHLRKLFIEHAGASPEQVALTRRVHFAKKLIDETKLSIRDVAYNAGFSSLRRFNDAFRKTFRCAPTDLHRRTNRSSTDTDRIEFRLPYRPPYAWDHLLTFLKARATPGVEAVGEDHYRRTVSVAGSIGEIEIGHSSSHKNELYLRVDISESVELLRIIERVREMFDIRSDPLRILTGISSPSGMANLVDRTPGIRIPGCWDGFELAARTILGQQVSVKAATTIAGRVAESFGKTISQSSELRYLFPSAQRLSTANLESRGVIASRAAAIRSLAGAVAKNQIVINSTVDSSELCRQLCEIPGIGPWTAQYVAMRASREPDAFPASDLALRKVFSEPSKVITEKQLANMAEQWRPWRSYAAMYLWTAEPGSLATELSDN